jgi:hypothetical protein
MTQRVKSSWHVSKGVGLANEHDKAPYSPYKLLSHTPVTGSPQPGSDAPRASEYDATRQATGVTFIRPLLFLYISSSSSFHRGKNTKLEIRVDYDALRHNKLSTNSHTNKLSTSYPQWVGGLI